MTPLRHVRPRAGAYAWPEIEARWAELVPDLCGTWPKLTYMEALATVGQRSRVCELLAERYGLTSEEADDALFAWQAELARRHGSRPLAQHVR